MSSTDTIAETVDKWHRNYQRGLITLGELVEELAKIDRRHGPQPVTRAELEDNRARCVCSRHADGSVTTSLCPVHADQDPCLTMSQVTSRRRTGTIRRGECTSCGHRS